MTRTAERNRIKITPPHSCIVFSSSSAQFLSKNHTEFPCRPAPRTSAKPSPCADFLSASDKRAESAGDFLPAFDKHESCATNSFLAFNEMPARAEIPSRHLTERRCGRKFLPVTQQDAGTRGNSFPDSDKTPARTEILSCASGCAENTKATNRRLCGGKNTQSIRRHV